MAKIKCEINEDSILVKFESLVEGEVFVMGGKACIKVDKIYTDRTVEYVNAIGLESREAYELPDDALVTYVKKAELKLTI